MPTPSLQQRLRETDYVEERLRPQPGEGLYLHLSDLRMAMAEVIKPGAVSVLDYGCGGSPYRQLFQNTDYKRADFLDCGELDYKLAEDSRVPEKNCTFDFILSTQVLEHVTDPRVYLAECHRLLKPEGELALTTHGTFEDHGCPYDFHRWTAEGLRRILEASGFDVVRLDKLTTGPRAVVFLCERFASTLSASRRTAFGLVLWLLRKGLRRHKRYVHLQCDKAFAANRSVNATQQGHALYIGLLAVCRKSGRQPAL